MKGRLLNLSNYYLLVAVLVKRRIQFTVYYHVLGCLAKIKSKQDADDGRIWVSSLMIWYNPKWAVINSSLFLRLYQYHQTTSSKASHWNCLLLTLYQVFSYSNKLEVVQSLPKKYRIHYEPDFFSIYIR